MVTSFNRPWVISQVQSFVFMLLIKRLVGYLIKEPQITWLALLIYWVQTPISLSKWCIYLMELLLLTHTGRIQFPNFILHDVLCVSSFKLISISISKLVHSFQYFATFTNGTCMLQTNDWERWLGWELSEEDSTTSILHKETDAKQSPLQPFVLQDFGINSLVTYQIWYFIYFLIQQ